MKTGQSEIKYTIDQGMVIAILLSLIGIAGLIVLGVLIVLGFLPLVPYAFVGVVAIYLAFSSY